MAAKVKALQQWCKRQCEGYRDVDITNMTKSWKSGLAFCAILHRYRPDIIDYDSLSKENVYENNKLAFEVAQNELGIPALLDAEDMVAMTVPDKLCVVTYVSQYHNYFRKYQPAGGPGVKVPRTPSKRQPPTLTPSELPDTKRPARDGGPQVQTGPAVTDAAKRGTLGDTCTVCGKKVYIMERHIDGSKLYHRKCLREIQRSQRTSWSPTQKKRVPWSEDQTDSYLPRKDLSKSSTEQKGPSLVKTLQSAADSKKVDSKPHAPPAGSKSSGLVKTLYSPPQYSRTEDACDNLNKYNASNTTPAKPTVVNARAKPFKPAHSTTFGQNDKRSDVQPAAASRGKATGLTTNAHSLFPVQQQTAQSATSASSSHSEPMDIDNETSSVRPGHLPVVTSSGVSRPWELPVTSSSYSRPSRRDMPPRSVEGTNKGTANNSASAKAKSQGHSSSIASQKTSQFLPKQSQDDTKLVSGLLQNLADIRRRHSEDDVGGGTLAQDAQANRPSPIPSPRGHKVVLKSSPDASPQTGGSPSRFGIKSSPRDSPVHFPGDGPAPKPILKSAKQVAVADDYSSRNRSSSPPKSILKHADHTPPSDNSAYSRSTSPPKSILKHTEFSPDTKQMDAPPRSILKRGSFDSDGELDDRPRSILKSGRDSGGSDPDSGPNSRVTSPSRSILKNSADWTSSPEMDDSPRAILKQSPGDQRDSPRSILKKSLEWTESPVDSNQATSPSHGILKACSPTRDTQQQEPPKQSKPKSILKFSHPKAETDESEPKMAKPTWSPAMLKAKKSQGSPVASASFSNGDSNLNSDINNSGVSNNFSAFNVMDSISLADGGSDEKSRTTWHIEAEARIGGPQSKESKSDFANKVTQQHQQKQKHQQKPKTKSSPPSEDTSVPEWKLEAERRKVARGGKYEDPEKKHLQVREKTSPDATVPVTSNEATGSHSKTNLSKPKMNGHISEQEMHKSTNKTVAVGGARPKTPTKSPRSEGDRVKGQAGQGGAGGGARPKKKHAPPPPAMPAGQGDGDKPSWQKEAERRQVMRNGQYPDPEKLPSREHTPLSDRPHSPPKSPRQGQVKTEADMEAPQVNVPCYLGMNMSDMIQKQRDRGKGRGPAPAPPTSNPYHLPPPQQDFPAKPKSPPPPPSQDSKPRIQLNRSPAFRIPDSSESSPDTDGSYPSPPPVRSSPVPSTTYQEINGISDAARRKVLPGPTSSPDSSASDNRKLKKISPEVDFDFSASRDFGLLDQLDGIARSPPTPSPQAPPRRGSGGQSPSWMRNRPLPSVPDDQHDQMDIPKRRVNAEARMATVQIMEYLEGLDDQLRTLEAQGRDLEEKIRSESDEAMDEDELMVQWFELINQKNELVRKESELMYRQRQQELEDLHEELEYELRCLMDKPEQQKSSSDKIREEALLQELLDTVSQRNNIIDSIEEDRIRYIEEDQEIAEMLASRAQKKKKKNKKKGGDKKKGKDSQDKTAKKRREDNSSDDLEIDEIDCEKEREKEKKKDRKFFKISVGSSGS